MQEYTFLRLMPAHSRVGASCWTGSCLSICWPAWATRQGCWRCCSCLATCAALHVCVHACVCTYQRVMRSLWPGGSPPILDPTADRGMSGSELLALPVLSLKQIPRSRMTGQVCSVHLSLEGRPCCAFPAGQGPSACPRPPPQG